MNKLKKELTEKMKHAENHFFLSDKIFWNYWDNFRDEEITNLIEGIRDAI